MGAARVLKTTVSGLENRFAQFPALTRSLLGLLNVRLETLVRTDTGIHRRWLEAAGDRARVVARPASRTEDPFDERNKWPDHCIGKCQPMCR